MRNRQVTLAANSEIQIRGKIKRVIVRSAFYSFEAKTDKNEESTLEAGDNWSLEETANVLHLKNNTNNENKLVLAIGYGSEGNLESSAGTVKISGVESNSGALKTKLADVDTNAGALKTQLANVDVEDGVLKVKVDGVDAQYNSLPVRIIERSQRMNLKHLYYGALTSAKKYQACRVHTKNINRIKTRVLIEKIKGAEDEECSFLFYLGDLKARLSMQFNGPLLSFDTNDHIYNKLFDFVNGAREGAYIGVKQDIEILGGEELWIVSVDNSLRTRIKQYRFSIFENAYG